MNQFLKTNNQSVTGLATALIVLAILTAIGLFGWWAFTWTTHTLVWFIFIFGSILGSVRVQAAR